MTSLVFKGIAARKLRTTLTAIAIVLGAAMVTGTLVMGHTVKQGFHEWYTQANGTSAAVITGRWIARGCCASARSQSSRASGVRGRSMPSSFASSSRARSQGSRPSRSTTSPSSSGVGASSR